MTGDQTVYRLFRSLSEASGTKDWAIGEAEENLRLRFGATGKSAQLRTIPPSHFKYARTLHEEMRIRMERKRAEGYREIGQCTVDGRGMLKEVSRERDPTTTLHWAVNGCARQPMLERLAEIAKGIHGAARVHVDMDDAGLAMQLKPDPWRIGYQPGGGMLASGSGGGVVLPGHGPLPVLVLMALRRSFPGIVNIADGSGTTLDLKLSPENPFLAGLAWESVMEIADRLNLCISVAFTEQDLQGAIIF